MIGLIGYTGLVGKHILNNAEHNIDFIYNTKNINEIKNKEFDLLICSCLSGNKRIVNENSTDDFNNVIFLMNVLNTIKVNKLILISTIEVYDKNFIDESHNIDSTKLNPYGRNRYIFENYCNKKFNSYIIRLPVIFGKGIKKNVIFDLVNKKFEYINLNDIIQFYDLNNIYTDIIKIINNDLKISNLISEPILIKTLAKDIFNINLDHNNKNNLRNYNIYSIHYKLWNNSIDRYLYNKTQIYTSITDYLLKGIL